MAKRDFLASGENLASQGKLNDAIIQFRNAIQIDPKFGPARYQLANAALKNGDIGTAYREAVRAADLMPDDFEVQIRAGQMCLLAGNFDDAKSRAVKALSLRPDSAQAHILRGNALANLRDVDAALREIEVAIQSAPNSGIGYMNLGTLQVVKGNVKEAEEAFRRATAVDPKSVQAQLSLANFYRAVGKPGTAEQVLAAALLLDPQNVDLNRALALMLVSLHRTREAEKPLKLVAEKTNDLAAKLVLAQYYSSVQRDDEALQVLRGLAQDPKTFGVANAHTASILFRTGKKSEAYAALNAVFAKDPKNAPALLEKVELLSADGTLDQALSTAQTAVADNPRLADAYVALGRVRTLRGDWDEAVNAYNEALKISPGDVVALLELAQVEIGAGRPADGLRAAEGALAEQPRNARGTLLKARALLAQGNVASAEAPMTMLAMSLPNSDEVQAQLGAMYVLKHDNATARAAFERALALAPNNIDALNGVTAIDLKEKKDAAARARVDAAVSRLPDSSAVLLLAARTAWDLGDLSSAERSLRHAIEVSPSSLDAYSMLGRLYAKQHRLGEAIGEFDQLSSRQPRSVSSRTIAGILFQMQGKLNDAKQRYERALSVDSRSAVAANNLALIYLETGGNLEVALQLAQTAKAGLPDMAEVNDTLGWVYCKKGLGSLAIPLLEQSLAKDPGNSGYLGHLGVAYAKAGQTDKARDALNRAFAHGQAFPDAAEARTTLTSLGSRAR